MVDYGEAADVTLQYATRRPTRRSLDFGWIPVSILAGLAAVFASDNWCFVAIPAAVVGLVTDALGRALGARYIKSRVRRHLARLGLAVLAGGVTGRVLHVSPGLGIPGGVRGNHADGNT